MGSDSFSFVSVTNDQNNSLSRDVYIAVVKNSIGKQRQLCSSVIAKRVRNVLVFLYQVFIV